MTGRGGLLLGALAVLVMAGDAQAQVPLRCPAGTRFVSQPAPDGGGLEYCESRPAVQHGPIAAWYEDGQKRLEGQYRDGKPDGRWRGWHPNGRPAGEADLDAGQLHRLIAWWDDGAPAFEGDIAAGRLTVFDQRGRRRATTDRADGQLTGRFWDEQGREAEAKDADLTSIPPHQFVRAMLLFVNGMPPR